MEKAFDMLVPETNAERIRPTASKFIKKLDEIPLIPLPTALPRRAAVSLADRALVGQFTGLWPSPRTVQKWVERNWNAMVQGKIAIRFCGRGYYTFLFETVEDRNLIFKNGPYFMDTRGLYLNRWTPDFDPEMDVPNAVPVWVRLPHLPLHCWGDESVRAIGNAVGKYVDRSEPKENMYACARICVEVDLSKGLPEAVKLQVDRWTHIQQVDYEQLPFKCKVCHEYGHFANRCTKFRSEDNASKEPPEEAWEIVRKKKKSNPPQDAAEPSSKKPPSSNHPSSSGPPPPSSQQATSPSPPSPPRPSDPSIPPSSNPFASLSEEEPFPEPEHQSSSPPHTSHPSPNNASARITRSLSKDLVVSSETQKKHGPGRKSAKQHREESAQKDIAMGSQTPIETYILGISDKGNNLKGKERRAPPNNTGK